MTHLSVPETGYTSSPEARRTAWQSLCLAAHRIMWGVPEDHPVSVSAVKGARNYWERGSRAKYLAVPYYEMNRDTDRPSGYLPVELRVLRHGGTNGVKLYKLRSADLEIVWSNQEEDVLLCEMQGNEIIDGLDANEITTLTSMLDYETCIAYNPRQWHINDEGALVAYDPPQETYPPSVA